MSSSLDDELRRLRVAVARRRGLPEHTVQAMADASSPPEAYRFALRALSAQRREPTTPSPTLWAVSSEDLPPPTRAGPGLAVGGATARSEQSAARASRATPTRTVAPGHVRSPVYVNVEAEASGVGVASDLVSIAALTVAVLSMWNPGAVLPEWREIAALALVTLTALQRFLRARYRD